MRAGLVRVFVVAALAASVASTSPRANGGEGAVQVRDPQATLVPGVNGATGTGVIAGTIVAADTGKPLRRARVNLSAIDPRIGKSTITDDQGRFSFTELPPTDYDLSASRTGFIDMAFGQKRPGIYQQGTAIHLIAKQQFNNAGIALPRGSVLTGMVVDDVGDPAMSTQVRALRWVLRNGERTLMSQGTGNADDRGIYRIPSLPPGDYVVMAVPRDTDDARMVESMMRAEQTAVAAKESAMVADLAMQLKMADAMKQATMAMSGLGPDIEKDPAPGYAPVYYPGTTIGTNATTVTLGVSEERTNLNLQLTLVPMARMTGTVTNPDGTPASASLQLVDSTQALPGLNVRTARSGPDGRFGFTGLPPGQYTLTARLDVRKSGIEMEKASFAVDKPGPGAKEMAKETAKAAPPLILWATTDVAINGRNALNIALALKPGMSVTGGLSFDGTAPRPDVSRTRLQLTSMGTAMTEGFTGAVDANGAFTVPGGVPPGKYRIAVSGAGAYKPASALVGGRDVLDTLLEIKPDENLGGVDIKLSDKSTSLTGKLQDPVGQPTANYTVVVFPVDQRFWTPGARRIQGVRPSTDGQFSMRDLPPGEYRIGAVADVENGQWFDPSFLKQLLPASIQFTLGDGERRTQDLRVSR